MVRTFPKVLSDVQAKVSPLFEALEGDRTNFWIKGIKLVLSLLIFTILVALVGGVIKTFLDLRLLFDNPVEVALRHIIVDTLILLAVVEVFKTTLTYVTEGRVGDPRPGRALFTDPRGGRSRSRMNAHLKIYPLVTCP